MAINLGALAGLSGRAAVRARRYGTYHGFRAPAGTTVHGSKVGGRQLSPAQFRAGRLPGGVTLTSRFPAIIGGLQVRAHAASRETAEMIRDTARDNLIANESYDTGALYESLYVAELDEDYAVASDLSYAPFVEFGTRRSEEKPYLIPAVEIHRDDHINNVREGIIEACELGALVPAFGGRFRYAAGTMVGGVNVGGRFARRS